MVAAVLKKNKLIIVSNIKHSFVINHNCIYKRFYFCYEPVHAVSDSYAHVTRQTCQSDVWLAEI